jgi:hypothetical protein
MLTSDQQTWVNEYINEERKHMAKIGEMIDSKYLKQTDVADEMLVTVQKVGKANVARKGDEPEYKWLVRFTEFEKPMVLNSTNIKRLAKACDSEDTDEWTGKQVILYVDPDVEFGGNIVGGLRIRAKAKSSGVRQEPSKTTGGKFDDMSDDIPF